MRIGGVVSCIRETRVNERDIIEIEISKKDFVDLIAARMVDDEHEICGKRVIIVDEDGYQDITDLSSEWNEDAIYKLVSDTMMLKTENEEIKKELYHTAKDLHDMRKHAMDLEQKVSKLEKYILGEKVESSENEMAELKKEYDNG